MYTVLEREVRPPRIDEIVVSKEIYNTLKEDVKFHSKKMQHLAEQVGDAIIGKTALFLIGYSLEDVWILNGGELKEIYFNPKLHSYKDDFKHQFESNRNNGGNILAIKAGIAWENKKQLFPDISLIVKMRDGEWTRVRRVKKHNGHGLDCTHRYPSENREMLNIFMNELHRDDQMVDLEDTTKLKNYISIVGNRIKRIQAEDYKRYEMQQLLDENERNNSY
jgi:hypothetical protein